MKRKTTGVISHHLSDDDSKEFMVFHINKRVLNSREFKPYNIFNPFRSDFFAIIMVHEGAIEVSVNLQQVRVEKNGLLAFSPNMIKHLISISDNCKFYALLYKSSFLMNANIKEFHQDVYDLLMTGMPLFDLTANEVKILGNLLEIMFLQSYSTDQSSRNEYLVKYAFLAFMHEYTFLYRKYNKAATHGNSRREDILLRFIRLVADHFKEERSVDFYAKKLFITPKYLSEVTKEITGKTASSIIAEMVIMEAKSLLNNSSLSVVEIANFLHFSDMSFFGKYFKRYTSQSPSAYRKANTIS